MLCSGAGPGRCPLPDLHRCPACSAPPSNLVRCQRCSVKKAIDGEAERARPQSKKINRTGELEKATRKPIRPKVNRPHGFAVPDDPEAIRRENALMEELHEKAVAAERRQKLKLLLRRHSLAEEDYEGLALALAIEHEPGFRVDRQIAQMPPGFSGPVRLKDGKLVDAPKRRPLQWTVERLLRLLEAVQVEKEKSGLTKDLEVLQRLAGQNEWTSANDRSNSLAAHSRPAFGHFKVASMTQRKLSADWTSLPQ